MNEHPCPLPPANVRLSARVGKDGNGVPPVGQSAPSAPNRHGLFAFLAVSLSLVACLIVAEVVLRFLPVATGMWALPVDAAHPIFRFTPNQNFLFSRDWN